MTIHTASSNITTGRLFDPDELSLVDDGWHAVGYCHSGAEIRMFAAQGVRSVEETAKRSTAQSASAPRTSRKKRKKEEKTCTAKEEKEEKTCTATTAPSPEEKTCTAKEEKTCTATTAPSQEEKTCTATTAASQGRKDMHRNDSSFPVSGCRTQP